jgi:STE24 endopeptidase
LPEGQPGKGAAAGRLRRLARPTTLALIAAAALWAWAAHALWSSGATPSVHLPDLESSRFFSEHFLHRSASYQRFLEILALLATVVVLVVLWLYAGRAQRLMRESAAGRIGTGILLGMLGLAIVWLAELPFGLLAVWWQRRYDVSHQGYLSWVLESFFGLGAGFVFFAAALAIAMALAGVMRRWWWIVAAPLFVGLALLFTALSPYLIPNTEPLRDPQLLADARALERSEGLGETRVRVQDVHRYTTAPNAEASGIGATRTVVLWDTLVNGNFSRAEIRAVVAHELAHLAHNDPLRGVGWLALFLVPATALIALLTRRRGGLANPEAVPLALFLLIALQVLATPLFNAVSRRQEAAADWAALAATRQPAAQRAVMRRLATTSMTSPERPGWSNLLLAGHPPIIDRIAMTYAWEEQSSRPPPRDARRTSAASPGRPGEGGR